MTACGTFLKNKLRVTNQKNARQIHFMLPVYDRRMYKGTRLTCHVIKWVLLNFKSWQFWRTRQRYSDLTLMNLRSNVAPVVMVAGDFKKVQSTDIQSLIQSRHLFTLYATSLPTSVSLSLGYTSISLNLFICLYLSMPIHITVKRYGEIQKGSKVLPQKRQAHRCFFACNLCHSACLRSSAICHD